MMICSLSVAPMPPYCFGQCGATQPLWESVRYQGINSAGGGRVVRPRSATGRLASSQVRTSLRNSASSGVSWRNMMRRFTLERDYANSFRLDVCGLNDAGPERQLRFQHLAEVFRRSDFDVRIEIVQTFDCLRIIEGIVERRVEFL